MDVLIVTLESGHQSVDRTLAKKSHTTWSTTPVNLKLKHINNSEVNLNYIEQYTKDD